MKIKHTNRLKSRAVLWGGAVDNFQGVEMKLRLLKLDNFYDNIHNPEAGTAFLQMVRLRAQGFGPDYPGSYLPIDSSDYVVWHYILQIEDLKGDWIPISCWRETSLSRCDRYKITPGFVTTVKDCGVESAAKSMEQLVKQCRDSSQELLYIGGFTVLREYRRQSKLLGDLSIFDILMATTVFDQMAHNGTMISGGAIRFKIHLSLQKSGFVPFEWEGQPVPPFKKASSGEPMLLVKLEKFSEYALECYRKYEDLIKSMIVIGGTHHTTHQEDVIEAYKQAA